MALRCHWWRSPYLVSAMALLVIPALVAAGPRSRANSAGDEVELFTGMAAGQLDVKVIPKDSTQLRVMITNKTDKPLSVKLPEAFAAVPVLAQAAGGAGGGRQRNTDQNQAMGGGMGGMGGMGGGGGGVGGGFFNVAPEAVGQIKATTVCLEHGKAEPHAAVPYELRPIENVTSKPEVQEVCKLLGQGQLNQRVAQVAAWHLNNNMSWEQLARKELRFADGRTQPYFAPQEIRAAMQLVAAASKIVAEREKAQPASSQTVSPGQL